MTPSALLEKLRPFRDRKIIDCIDEIRSLADGFTVNVMDPTYNVFAIDNDYRRLNVKTDADGVITSFTVG